MIAMNLPLRKSVCEPDSVNKIIPKTIIASEIKTTKNRFGRLMEKRENESGEEENQFINSRKNITIYVSITNCPCDEP